MEAAGLDRPGTRLSCIRTLEVSGMDSAHTRRPHTGMLAVWSPWHQEVALLAALDSSLLL